MRNPANSKTNPETAPENSNQNVNRDVVLQWLKEDIEFLRRKARCKNPIKNPIRVKLLRASIYGCSVLLQALKDAELEEIAERLKRVEEALDGGVVIPVEKQPKR